MELDVQKKELRVQAGFEDVLTEEIDFVPSQVVITALENGYHYYYE